VSGLVDAHVHVWDPAIADYPWMVDTPELRRRFDLDRVGSDLERLGVDGVVLVQAADNVDDTNNMLAAAERHPCVLGVVAWLPLTEPDRAAAQLDAWSERPIVGIRHLIHRDPDP
jgi:L-fuconolactonase